VSLDICQTTGLITLIRTNFAMGTAICRTTNLYTFSDIVEYLSKAFILATLFATYDKVSSQLHYPQETAIGPYSEPHESSHCHHIPFTSNLNTLVPSQAFHLRHDFQQTACISHLSCVCHTPNQPILIRSIILM